MDKSIDKKEYITLPTSDIEEAQLPAYEEETPVDKSQNRRRKFRFLLIGGAIALLGLTHLCSSNNMFKGEFMTEDFENHEPCALNQLEQYTELKQHMQDLKESFGHFGRHHKGGFEGAFATGGHDHHREHKSHHKHHGHKHDGEAPPDAPPAGEFEQDADDVSIHGGNDKKKPHHHHEPFCKIEELEATSTLFNFSPEEFKRAAVYLNGWFSRGGHVRLLKSSDESVKDVKVNITLYTGRKDLVKEVKLSAFDHEGQYAVQIERGHFLGHGPRRPRLPHPPHGPHRGDDDDDNDDDDNDDDDDEAKDHHKDHKKHEEDREEDKKERCLVYNIDIEFPANMDYFEDLELHIKAAQRIQGGPGIGGIEFGSVKAGLGHGAIIFDGLRAKKLMLGVVNGVVMGTYQPSQIFAAGTIHGATKVNIEPTGENINITASSIFGPASVNIPADSYSGKFILYNLFGETSTIQAPNPEDIHVTRFTKTLKAGYYKEEETGSKVVVAAKLHGGETLIFN